MKRLFMLAAALVLTALQVRAQELPASVKGASAYPDGIVCRGWQMFESGDYTRRIRDATLSGSMASVTARLRQLCQQAPGDENVGPDSAAWLTKVDNVFDDITTSLFERMSRPVSAGDRAVLRDILQTTTTFQRNFELLRVLVYTAQTIKVVESVKTVEVPAQCPACPDLRCPEPPPQIDPMADERAGCISAAHDTARQAKTALDKINYANASLSAIRDLSGSLGECTQWSFSGEPQCPKSIFQRLPGWARMADGILDRDGKLNADQQMSADVRGRVEGVAIALRSQLRTCGRF